MTDEARKRFEKKLFDMGEKALRSIGLAYRCSDDNTDWTDSDEPNLVLVVSKHGTHTHTHTHTRTHTHTYTHTHIAHSPEAHPTSPPTLCTSPNALTHDSIPTPTTLPVMLARACLASKTRCARR